MGKLKKNYTVGGSVYGWDIWCPGCQETHTLRTINYPPDKGGPGWSFNENFDKPTFTPSLLVRGYCGPGVPNGVCHSFITDGKIQFLDDCTHELRGQTVELPDHDSLSRKG